MTSDSTPQTIGNHYCFACGKAIDPRAEICPNCGVRQRFANPTAPLVGRHQRLPAALLAILLGGFGAHKFYLGKIGQGVLYLLFCWTFIPLIVGFIEGIVYLSMTDERFNQEYP